MFKRLAKWILRDERTRMSDLVFKQHDDHAREVLKLRGEIRELKKQNTTLIAQNCEYQAKGAA